MIRIALILFLCVPAMGATLYCGPSATGTGSGSDFNNRFNFTGFTGGVRGNTYKLIEGSYGSIVLGTAASGTTTITVEYVTSADSGVAGYSSTLHDGQAVFGTITFNDPYYIVDGKTRTETAAWAAPAGYGFKATQVRSSSLDGDNGDNGIARYIDAGDNYSLSYSGGDEAFYLFGLNNFTVSRCAAHMSTHALMQAANTDGLTVEYTHFGPGWGKEAIRGGNGGGSNWIIRHNRFWNSSQVDPMDGTSGITAEIDIFGDDGAGAYASNAFYGNWFYNEHSGGRNSTLAVGGQGFTGTAANCVAYNNTFAGIAESSVFAMVLLSGTGNIARNNLFYDCVDTDVSANTVSDNDVAGADPFVNYATLDLRLSGATSPGTTLASPYDTDPNGVTRAVDSTWDVGAFEFDSGAGDVVAPTFSSANIPTGGTTLNLVLSETCANGAGGNGGVTLSASGGAVTATYSSGSSSSTFVYSLSRTINSGETVTVSYTQPGNGIEDTAGNDLATFSGNAVTNNSSQGGASSTSGVSVGSGVVFSSGVINVK